MNTKLLTNIIISLVSLVITLLCIELVLALFWPHQIVRHTYHEQYHPIMGWINKPDVKGIIHIGRTLSFERTHNSHGLRSLHEIEYEKLTGIKRILLLGDSFFWGFGVNDRDVVSEILQKKVGSNTEIINGSVTGYGTDQELLWFIEEGIKYKPDVVVLGFFPTNDVDEISKSIMYSYPKPYFLLVGNELAVKNIPVPDTRETRRKGFDSPDSIMGKIKKILRQHTHLYPFLAARLNSVSLIRRFSVALGLGEEFTNSMPGIPDYQLKGDRVQDLADALIIEIKRRAQESGAAFLLVHIPRRELGPGEKPEQVYGMSPKAWNDQVSTYLTSFTAKKKIAYLDMLPIMRDHEQHGEILYNHTAEDHHWTPLGHLIAAGALFDWLKNNSWIQ